MKYRVILTYNGKYKKTLHICKTRETSFLNYRLLIEKNKEIKFPKKFVNTKKISPVKYEICIVKPIEENDKFRILRDGYGKTYVEKPIGDWIVIDSHPYDIEETFWIYGRDPKANRPKINDVVKLLMSGAYKRNMVKQVIIVYNKLIIYNEEQFEMVLCKCREDAQRLHNTLSKIAKKQKIKNLLFMGIATPATISRMYDMIQEETGWPIIKIRRTNTRP
jgi:hypothetical protein